MRVRQLSRSAGEVSGALPLPKRYTVCIGTRVLWHAGCWLPDDKPTKEGLGFKG
jgi:hypothetical protein